jgi:FeS assembly protein IscX
MSQAPRPEHHPPALDWADAREIGFQLVQRFPALDPLCLRFTDLHRMVCELPGFRGDPKASNEKLLEGIQMAWLDEREP